MKIQSITYRSRRDFKAIYVCESCNASVENWGYEDANFHENVIPEMECKSCGKASNTVTSQSFIPANVVM